MAVSSSVSQVWRRRILGSTLARRAVPQLARDLCELSWRFEAKRLNRDTFVHIAPEVFFVWIPKTAGTSVAKWLRRPLNLVDLPSVRHFAELSRPEADGIRALTVGHQSVDALISLGLLQPRALNSSYSFAFVRNPYDRLVSLWRYLVAKGRYSPERDFTQFVRDLIRERPQIGLYNIHGLSMAAPMANWVTQRYWDGPTHVFRYESLEDSIEQLRAQVGVPAVFPSFNNALTKAPQIEVGEGILEEVANFYKADFETFGYSTTPPTELFALK